MDFFYLIITGLTVGFMSSFFGIGGGSLIMPILFMLYPEVPAQAIIPSSLGVIFLNTLVNNFNFYKQKLSASRQTIINFALTCSIGGTLGALCLHLVDSDLIKKLFALILIIVAIKLYFSRVQDSSSRTLTNHPEPKKIAFTGFLGSFISSLTGLGGGIVFVPMLVSVVKLPLVLVSSYSNIAMTMATFVGVLPHFFSPINIDSHAFYAKTFIGHVNIGFILLIFLGSIITSNLGAKLNTKIDFKLKKNFLSILLMTFAVKILL